MIGVLLILVGIGFFLIGLCMFTGARTDFTIGVDEGVLDAALSVIDHALKEKTVLKKDLGDDEYRRTVKRHLVVVLSSRADEKLLKKYSTC